MNRCHAMKRRGRAGATHRRRGPKRWWSGWTFRSIAAPCIIVEVGLFAIVITPRREGEDEECEQREEGDSHHLRKDEPGGPNFRLCDRFPEPGVFCRSPVHPHQHRNGADPEIEKCSKAAHNSNGRVFHSGKGRVVSNYNINTFYIKSQ